MLALRKKGGLAGPPGRLGTFKSYDQMVEWLRQHGETGEYYSVPIRQKGKGWSLKNIRTITVEKYDLEENEIGNNGDLTTDCSVHIERCGNY